jgi:hypothetical protein
MATHCGARVLVSGGQGQDFRTVEACPAGARAGLTPSELYERCLHCPVARRMREKKNE